MVRVACSVPGNFLAEGQFSVIVAIYTYDPVALHAVAHDAVAFQIVDPSDGDGVRGPYPGEWVGAVRPMLDWDVKRL
jgi:lipopolysaccharide transport system ATP-binding protein